MKTLRNAFYFEPRCVGEGCIIRWYGEQYGHDALLKHMDKTVYVRDNGRNLYVYQILDDDKFKIEEEELEIKATFKLICRVKKYSNNFLYGKNLNKMGRR